MHLFVGTGFVTLEEIEESEYGCIEGILRRQWKEKGGDEEEKKAQKKRKKCKKRKTKVSRNGTLIEKRKVMKYAVQCTGSYDCGGYSMMARSMVELSVSIQESRCSDKVTTTFSRFQCFLVTEE
ncbi:hypothetical protein HPP92_004746 [Vanilla planifolia]|uniref:Uncharacterized protein n=1 Tax=Vanilla planifolia TaxID=51239 RepID=A0A835RXA5_VANPL|nr:hypothetical protein HPP92_004746 [Vanilla planifolia]